MYDFCLLKKTFNYNYNVSGDKNYLLFDTIIKNELQLFFIDLSNFANQENKQLIQLLNFKINNNIPKIVLNQGFKKFINIYDNNQLCIMDYVCEQNLINNNEMRRTQINLNYDYENLEIIPKDISCSSTYDSSYCPQNLFKSYSYYCSETNKNEYILFDFEREYCFRKIILTYNDIHDPYKKARLKKFKVIIMDRNKAQIYAKEFTREKISEMQYEFEVEGKGRYIKFELLENFGEDYFTIGGLKFFLRQTYSLQ
jgi:hypothetical protein